MSNTVTSLCRQLKLPPTQKSVLMCEADYCHDDGMDWHSIGAIMEWTCLGKTAVIDALKGLEQAGLIKRVHQGNGQRCITYIQIDAVAEAIKAQGNQCASRTGPPAEPVRVADMTGSRGGPELVRVADQPVREADPKHQEASVKHQKASKGPSPKLPEWIPQDAWNEFKAMRTAKRKPMTAKAVSLIHLKLWQLKQQGHEPRAVLEQSVLRSWTDVYAIKSDRGGTSKPALPRTFADQTYSEEAP